MCQTKRAHKIAEGKVLRGKSGKNEFMRRRWSTKINKFSHVESEREIVRELSWKQHKQLSDNRHHRNDPDTLSIHVGRIQKI
jgi:hypothetical protein